MATTEVLPTHSDKVRTASRHPVDLLKAYKLRVQHKLTYQQIADSLGQPKSSIHQALTNLCDLIDDPDRLVVYEDARPKLLSLIEERLIGSLADKDKLEKASLNNVAYALTQIHTARRLEEGQSTNNVSLLAQVIAQAESQIGAGKAQAHVQAAPCLEKSQAEPEQAR